MCPLQETKIKTSRSLEILFKVESLESASCSPRSRAWFWFQLKISNDSRGKGEKKKTTPPARLPPPFLGAGPFLPPLSLTLGNVTTCPFSSAPAALEVWKPNCSGNMIHPQTEKRKTRLPFPTHFLLLLLLTVPHEKGSVRHCKMQLECFDVGATR